ncbi:hypothetical protein ACVGOW_27505 [Pseudonocardia saturnea]
MAAEISMAHRGPGLIDFAFLWQRTGSVEGGRALFEELVQDLAGVEHPDLSTVEANPGDWGIDAFVGQLVEGSVAVWQAKYFINGFGSSQQSEVRDSFKSAKESAARNGYRLQAWTLAIPVALDGPMNQWWEGWKKRTEKKENVVIELWHKVALRRRLIREGAREVYGYYFNPVMRAAILDDDGNDSELKELPDPQRYDGALFVRQMHEAGLADCRSAREEFFNAEILTQEILDKSEPREVKALRSWSMALRSAWSHRYNDHCQRETGRQLPGLFGSVMHAVHEHHPNVPRFLRATAVHGNGLVHHEVDNGGAGWVRDWSDIATDHPADLIESISVQPATEAENSVKDEASSE